MPLTLLMFLGSRSSTALVLVDRLLPPCVVVFRSVGAGNVLLRKRGGQIEARIQQGGIERHRLLKVVDGLFVLGVLVGLHALVELVARSQLAAARGGKQRQTERRHAPAFVRLFSLRYKSPLPENHRACALCQIGRALHATGADDACEMETLGGPESAAPRVVPANLRD